jgi:hypothetical protein
MEESFAGKNRLLEELFAGMNRLNRLLGRIAGSGRWLPQPILT